jgi:hypothetical protein
MIRVEIPRVSQKKVIKREAICGFKLELRRWKE